MNQTSARKYLCFFVLLVGSAACLAQQPETLPDAPRASPAAGVPADLPPAVIAAATPAAGKKEPVSANEPIAPEKEVDAQPWLSAHNGGYQPTDEDAAQGVRIDLDTLFARMAGSGTGSLTAVGADGIPELLAEHYHWKGLLWESFAFFGVENTQRLLSDPFFRHLTLDEPYWHDYIASLKHWNWRRWNDGDDFLVAYIAHPLQGSVTQFIEIQNSPRDRELRIDDGHAYWKSRLGPSLLWSTAYSFDQKLGPLGEAALGSEGGYNYVAGCPFYCSAYFANPSQFKVTNNTGWVKLVTTPVVGTLWTVMEDALDRFVSDRVQGDDIHRTFPKILRGSLNPARTMANALRWRVPWYRDWQHDSTNVYFTPRPHFLPGDDAVILAAPRYDFFPHFNGISLPVNTQSCMHCRQSISGYGFGFAARIATYADLDSDVNFMPNASPVPSDRAGGNATLATFGLRSGYTSRYFSLKAFLRPGILSYSSAYQSSPSSTNPTPTIGRITHFSTALGIDGDLNINRHLALRGVIGNTAVRYREPATQPPSYIPGTYPYLTWLSKLEFLTNENWNYQAGAVLRF